MDELWAVGWRHFGADFFRASLMADEMCLKRQIALRVDLRKFARSRSQRRTMRRNQDLVLGFTSAEPGEVEGGLFEVHKTRFVRNVPDSLDDFLGDRPNGKPCECLQLSAWSGDRLVAASFLALGRRACSSVYAVFDPDCGNRRLGIFTMLCEMQYAAERGYEYFYSGYATVEPSCYDYKRQFAALEYYDWQGRWNPIEELRG
jgi:arginine-tRNA-protein transferase